MSEIVNKVKESKLETIDLEQFLVEETVFVLDIRQFLFQEMILREQEFRRLIGEHDWSQYENGWLAVTCSSDAIIPSWAWMLVATHALPYVKEIVYGNEEQARSALLKQKMEEFDWRQYEDKFVLLKGCSKMKIPASAYLEATRKLMPVAGKLMYGEACSNVPVYRKPRS